MEKFPRIAITVKIDPTVWSEAKKYATDHDLELSELVEEAILDWIKKMKQ